MKIPFRITPGLFLVPSLCFSGSGISLAMHTVHDTAEGFKISTSLPKFDSHEYPALNFRVKEFSDSVVNDFVEECKASDQTKDTAAQSHLAITTENLRVSISLISFCFRVSTWHFHAAHPYDVLRTVNYQISKDRILSPVEMLAIPANRIKELLAQKLRSDGDDCFDPEELRNENPDRFQISLERDSVVFNFSQAEIGAYVCGERRVRLPVKGLIKESF